MKVLKTQRGNCSFQVVKVPPHIALLLLGKEKVPVGKSILNRTEWQVSNMIKSFLLCTVVYTVLKIFAHFFRKFAAGTKCF